MKYIKTYESSAIEKITNIQDMTLSIFNFIKKIKEIFLNTYNINVKVSEEDSPFNVISSYSVKYGGNVICKLHMQKRNIELNLYNTPKKDFDNFIFNFLDINKIYSRRNYKIKIVSKSELDEYSNKIVEEFDLYINPIKYNL